MFKLHLMLGQAPDGDMSILEQLTLSDSAGHCVYYKAMLLIINFIKKLCYWGG
jgi:hypothetical protein